MNLTIKQSKKDVCNPAFPLFFIDSVHFLNNSLDNLVRHLREKDYYQLSQKFEAIVLDCAKMYIKKGFLLYDYWNSFEKLKEVLPSKDKFYNSLINREILNIRKAFAMKIMKIILICIYKLLFYYCVFENFSKEFLNS